MSRDRIDQPLLAPHAPSLPSLVFGLGFGLLGIIVLSDTSLESTASWLWALALIVVGLAAMVSVLDGLRSRRPKAVTSEPSPTEEATPVAGGIDDEFGDHA